ncbi:Crp/Fnr family transcriptional regulator [Lutibacter flavus]|uniref:CRP/FNR family transcriptional regulator, anaerobic regulatory protein n=1 Tax=Lutibacter flavus TaxID=691689 RepID=A0A238V7J0_9FLAO|nr:Crp/Fnr family transcriptional regulator [Lutibacter flavus]SNR30412.1 CRP/FNR family transcriptional regulator, anaerobic regulatory protein [Lutibacter flavus]
MTNDKDFLREKLNDHYASIFEEELINEIIKIGMFRTIDSGDILIDIGDKMSHIPLILHGAVKIIREDNNGEEIALYFLEKGDTCAISFVNCIHKTKSIFRGVTERETEGIFIPVEFVDNWLVKYESWRHFIIDSYHLRLIEMVESIDSLAFTKLDDRLHKYLVEKVKVMKNNTLIITHQEIANDINTSRVVVSRLLKLLENEGKIKIRRNRIIIDHI